MLSADQAGDAIATSAYCFECPELKSSEGGFLGERARMIIARKSCIWLMGVVLAVTGFVTLNTTPAQSHSGGLDAAGGHHCWTSCASYGMETGEYRCHSHTKRCKRSNRMHHDHGHK